LLYTIKKAVDGVDADYANISEEPSWKFKSELDPVFFEGYNDRIRNAIAHARFSYDEHTKKMTFKDRANRKQPAFTETLSIEEFGIKYYGKVDSLCRLRLYYMPLLGVRELAIRQKPFGVVSLRSRKNTLEKKDRETK
jgi:hypothetical protein